MHVSKEVIQGDVKKFRSSMNQETLDQAEKSLRLTRVGEVGILEFDLQGEKVNKLSSPIMLRLYELLLQIEQDKSLKSLVLISRKPSIFIAGADIGEIQQLSSGGQSAESLMKLQNVFTFLEALPIPTIAAIHGAALGGGLEITLACDYRIATDAKETRLGLPEVQLGVLPGWGGTQRLPRIVGLEKALDLILTGRHLDGRAAKRMGLVDKVVPKEWLEKRVLDFARSLKGKKRPKGHPNRDFMGKVIDNVPGASWIVFEKAEKTVMEKTKGNYPAPLKIISVLRNTFGKPLEVGLKAEAEAFIELVGTPEAKNLIGLFFLSEASKKDMGVEAKIKPKKVELAAVVGAGVMGGGIAQLFAAKGIRVRMKDIQWGAVTKGYEAAASIFRQLVKRRKLTVHGMENAMALIEGTTRNEGLKKQNLVVEAVVENLEIKKKVFEELDSLCDSGTILATNTSSLSISAIAEGCKHPERVVGMHFFNPVHKMPLVEVIRAKQTHDEAVATIVDLSKKLGKTPIVVKDAPGFVVNRILGPYLNESIYLLLDGIDPQEIDRLMEKFGMPMGPLTLLDEVGLDVASKVSKVLFGAFGDRMKPPAVMEKITDGNRLGKKSGKGIYYYSQGKRQGVDTQFLGSFSKKKRAAHLNDEVVTNRMVYLMVNEAARIVEEGIVRKVSDLDVGMIYGTGFAPFRGGLLKFADSVGVENIASDLDVYARQYGSRFQPCTYLQKLAVSKQKFYAD